MKPSGSRLGIVLWWTGLVILCVVVVILNRMKIPDWVSYGDVQTFTLIVLSANLVALAVCTDLALGSIARWAAGLRRGGPAHLLADSLPILLLVGYVGIHLAGKCRFYTGTYAYFSLIGGG